MLLKLVVELIIVSLLFQLFEIILPSGQIGEITRSIAMLYFLSLIIKTIALFFIGGVTV